MILELQGILPHRELLLLSLIDNVNACQSVTPLQNLRLITSCMWTHIATHTLIPQHPVTPCIQCAAELLDCI